MKKKNSMHFKFWMNFCVKKMKILIKMILNYEVITPTPLDFTFPAHRIVSNLKGGQSYVSSNFKRFLTLFLQKLKNKQKKLIDL